MSEHNGFPAFSTSEFKRRRGALGMLMERAETSVVMVFGSGRSAAEIQYLTNWIVQREGILFVSADADPTLYVQYYNHVPTARRMSVIEDVRWAGPDTTQTIVNHLASAGATSARIGYVGAISAAYYTGITRAFPQAEFVDLTHELTKVRLIKSSEELERLAKAATITDAAVTALIDAFAVGMTDRDVVATIQAAHAQAGGQTQVAFVASTSMHEPALCVPSQYPASRAILKNDAIIAEISAQYWGYSGQVLRTFTVGSDPTPHYAHLHETALEAFESILGVLRPGATLHDVFQAAHVIPASGLTIYDDLVHGYGGGYLPPIVRAYDFQHALVPSFAFEAGMVLVVQPNVVTKDGRSGVQVGEMVQITDAGVRRMHSLPVGPLRLG
jgi:Xaa-Pro aminopeptidase